MVVRWRIWTTGDIVLDIRPDRLEHYRKFVANIDAPAERKDEMIQTLARLMQSFVDAAFGVDPVQLVKRERLTDSFQRAAVHANVPHGQAAATFDSGTGGAITRQHETLQREPRDMRHEPVTNQKGSDLLPGF